MIVTLSGVTGCGKSYYKQYLVDKLNFENMIIYTTRKPRLTEIEGKDKYFITKEDLVKKEKNGQIFTSYEFLNEYYAYGTKYLSNDINSVTELHYEWIKDFKQKAKNVFSIYIFPTDIELARNALKARNLSQEMQYKRLKEIDEHIYNIKNDKNLLKNFDYIIYNDYTENTDKIITERIKILMGGKL